MQSILTVFSLKKVYNLLFPFDFKAFKKTKKSSKTFASALFIYCSNLRIFPSKSHLFIKGLKYITAFLYSPIDNFLFKTSFNLLGPLDKETFEFVLQSLRHFFLLFL